MSAVVSAIHISLTAGLCSLLAAAFRAFDADYPKVSVYHTYHLCALAGAGTALYYILYQFCLCVAPARWGLGRRMPAHLSPYYTDASEEPAGADLVLGKPRLTMQSVWGLVYGLGVIFAALAYTFAGQHPMSYQFLALGLALCCVWEAVQPSVGSIVGGLQIIAMLFSVSAVLVASVIGTPPTRLAELDLFSLAFGVVAPALAPVLLSYIRVTTCFYRVGSVLELCEFGLPFLLILVCAFLSVADAPHLLVLGWANVTSIPALEPALAPEGFWVLLLAAPPLLAAAVVLVVTAVVHGQACDPLIGVAVFCVGSRVLDPKTASAGALVVDAFLLACGVICRCLGTRPDVERVEQAHSMVNLPEDDGV